MSTNSIRGKAWEAQRQRVLQRDNWTCTSCGKHLEGSDATVDHVDPVVLNPGKKYRDDELVAMCRKCNGTKSDKVKVRLNYASPRWLPDGLPA